MFGFDLAKFVMTDTLALEPRKYYGAIPLYSLLFIVIISATSFALQPYSRVNAILIFLFLSFNLYRRRKFPLLTTSSDEICFNISRVNLSTSGECHIPINTIKKIWIGKEKFPMRKLFFLNSELDAIYVVREDERPFFLLTLNKFKPEERNEVRNLVENIQEIVKGR